jgi:hypothetical protein
MHLLLSGTAQRCESELQVWERPAGLTIPTPQTRTFNIADENKSRQADLENNFRGGLLPLCFSQRAGPGLTHKAQGD